MRLPFNGNFTQTQGFGGNSADYIRFGLRGHNGLDFALPSGTPLYAAISGKVIEATEDPTGYGKYIKLENSTEGALTAHMQSFTVSVGQDVNEGDLIGYSDNTGNSSGPHLHFGYYKIPRNRQNGYSGYIDPTQYINSSQTQPMDSKQTDKLVQFDRICMALKKHGITMTDDSNQFLGDDKLVKVVEGLLKDRDIDRPKASKYDRGEGQLTDVVKNEIYNNALKDVSLVVGKLSR